MASELRLRKDVLLTTSGSAHGVASEASSAMSYPGHGAEFERRALSDTPAAEVLRTRRWYACRTRARAEKQVDRLLGAGGVESYLGGHWHWSFLDTTALNEAYAASLAAVGKCDTLIAQLTAGRP